MEELLTAAGVDVDKAGLTVKWTANAQELDKCFAFGKEFGQKVLDKV
jgi:flavorubredoxin